MKKKVMVGLVSVVVAVALVFGGVTFYNNRQQEKFEKQMASCLLYTSPSPRDS